MLSTANGITITLLCQNNLLISEQPSCFTVASFFELSLIPLYCNTY
nr:MAG TPA: hypothetical protein [Caudoviricetes sp.]